MVFEAKEVQKLFGVWLVSTDYKRMKGFVPMIDQYTSFTKWIIKRHKVDAGNCDVKKELAKSFMLGAEKHESAYECVMDTLNRIARNGKE